MKIDNLKLECMQKAKLAAKKVALSTVLASSILSAAGCAQKPVPEPQRVEATDENLDNDLSNQTNPVNNQIEGTVYTDEEINSIIEAAYREGYKEGYYEAALLANINDLAHETNQLYVGIIDEKGEMNYYGINSLVCVNETINGEDKYYVVNCENEDTLYSPEGRFDFISGTELDHGFDLDTIRTVRFEDYVNEYYGPDQLKACYDAYSINSTDAFSKYDSTDFKQKEVYNILCDSKTK